MKLSDYQAKALETDQTPAPAGMGSDAARLIPLLGLAGEAGQLLSEFKKRLRDGPSHVQFVDRVAEELGDILWYVANTASKYGLDLDAVARANLTKVQALYGKPAPASNYDGAFGEGERLPRHFIVSFREIQEGSRVEVRTEIEGRLVGSALTDNAYQDDGYRFHDVFHVAYAAVLGWSPVLRGLLSLKRRSQPRISFYREAGGQQLFTSAAQMFDERGRGFVLKGKRAHTESRGRHPYMTQDDAYELISNVLGAYKTHHKHFPARVIVLKTSRFREDEAQGMLRALADAGAELRDLVWVQESYAMKLLRDGNYPVLRGTFVDLGEKGLLYTNGSMPYYGTYPGQYDPRPLLLCPHSSCDSTISQLAEEVLSLTKINWNSTQMNQRLPIPIRAARKVGEVLKYVKDGQAESSDYRRYI